MTKNFLAASSVSVALACALATPAFAQSTGSIDFEKEIIVIGTKTTTQAVGGVSSPDTAKAKAVLTAENIQRQNPGQSILDTINQVPGVSFQNNDAYGSAGGALSIRGFDASRISLTFDGVPLNDSGNYAIFSNQQIDPELIEQVNVNLGTTDIDSPTASAVGGTVNYRTKTPDKDLGATLSASIGEWDFVRMFGKVETGNLTKSGLRAFFSASTAKNRVPFNNYGKINKQQYNFKIYQPLNGSDFIAIAVNYNQNRNNFFGSLPLRTDQTQSAISAVARVPGPNSGNRYPITSAERFYNINYPCALAGANAGVADAVAAAPVNQASCGTEFDRRFNPSNTGNIRISSKFHLSDKLVLSVDPSYQFVKANGGGTVTGREQTTTIAGGTYTGFINGSYFFGRDLNGDGDILDQVTVLAPSQTQTKRLGVIANLRWDVTPTQTVRFGYSYDRARHRQTGEVGKLLADGSPVDVFTVNIPIATANGANMQKRDRLSYAILHKFSAEYSGKFMDNKLAVNLGLALPFYKRNLTNYCFTTSAGGFVDCFGQDATLNAAYAAVPANVYGFNAATNVVTGKAGPQQRIFNYKKLLPSVGFVYKFGDHSSLFANFSQGLSVPAVDSLYNAFYYPANTAQAQPTSETTDNFDMGVRYRSNKIQASFSAFYNQFQNRLASAYDPILDANVYRNLGSVKKYGVDGDISVDVLPKLNFHLFGSYIKSEIRDNIEIGKNGDGTPITANTAGKREAGMPNFTFGAAVRGSIGIVDIGVTAKRTGSRAIFDTNEATYIGAFIPTGAKACTAVAVPVCTTPALSGAQTTATAQIYGATAPAYWLVNLDARVNLKSLGLNDKSYVQLNVYNLFDKFYVGSLASATGLIQTNTFSRTTGTSTYGNPGNAQIGAPRTVSATLVIGF
jgi:iron complex outermembrane receptor protein